MQDPQQQPSWLMDKTSMSERLRRDSGLTESQLQQRHYPRAPVSLLSEYQLALYGQAGTGYSPEEYQVLLWVLSQDAFYLEKRSLLDELLRENRDLILAKCFWVTPLTLDALGAEAEAELREAARAVLMRRVARAFELHGGQQPTDAQHRGLNALLQAARPSKLGRWALKTFKVWQGMRASAVRNVFVHGAMDRVPEPELVARIFGHVDDLQRSDLAAAIRRRETAESERAGRPQTYLREQAKRDARGWKRTLDRHHEAAVSESRKRR